VKKAHVIVGGPVGLHARPAAEFVRIAERFRSDVRLTKDGMRVNAKSILAILTLAAEAGAEVVLEVNGADEHEAFEQLKHKLENSEA
jgi:phosphotransferase system HPr (HPr) family protein